MDALIVDYLVQLRDLLDDAIKRYQNRDSKVNHWHANEAIEDCVVAHNRLARLWERAGAENGR